MLEMKDVTQNLSRMAQAYGSGFYHKAQPYTCDIRQS
jgi:hypothetical protein